MKQTKPDDSAEKTKPKKQLIARIDHSLHTAVTALANVEDMTLTDYVERALRSDLASRREANAQLLSMYKTIDQIQQDLSTVESCELDSTT